MPLVIVSSRRSPGFRRHPGWGWVRPHHLHMSCRGVRRTAPPRRQLPRYLWDRIAGLARAPRRGRGALPEAERKCPSRFAGLAATPRSPRSGKARPALGVDPAAVETGRTPVLVAPDLDHRRCSIPAPVPRPSGPILVRVPGPRESRMLFDLGPCWPSGSLLSNRGAQGSTDQPRLPCTIIGSPATIVPIWPAIAAPSERAPSHPGRLLRRPRCP